jgi:hypothetical protein
MLNDTPQAAPDARVFDRAADLLEPEGAWIQKGYCRDGGRCIVSALSQAAMSNCQPYLSFMGWPHFRLATYWNDAPERTQPEVVAALRRAATLARAGEA